MIKGRVSVIIPVYGVEEYLDRCVQSVVSQTYRDLEIILVDDGSPDLCPEICDAWKARDHRIQVIHQSNKGISGARNSGLRSATGEYIAFVDSDDYIDPGMLEMMAAQMEDSDVGIVECGFYEILENETRKVQYENRFSVRQEAIRALLLWSDCVKSVVWNKLYRYEVIAGNQFLESLRYGEDTPFNYAAIRNTKSYVQIPYLGYHYVRRDTSLIGTSFNAEKMHSFQAARMVATEAAVDFPQLQTAADYHQVMNAYFLLRELFLCPEWQDRFSCEYAELIHGVRTGRFAELKKLLPAKTGAALFLCRQAPHLFGWLLTRRRF